MSTYYLAGTYRELGAIGQMTAFGRAVEADSEEAAKLALRQKLQETHEHILITTVRKVA